MRTPTLILPLLAVLGAASLAGPAAQAGADPRTRIGGTHCRTGERVAFSCALGRKTVSVCTDAAGATYRYGAPGKPEMEIRSTGADGKAHVGTVTGGGGGSEEHIRFTNGAFHYIVFNGVQGSLHADPGRRWSGLAVVRGDEAVEVSNKACSRNRELQTLPSELTQGRFPQETQDGPFDAWF